MENEMKELKLKSDRTKIGCFKINCIFECSKNTRIGKAYKDIRVLFNNLICDELHTTEQLRISSNKKTTCSSK